MATEIRDNIWFQFAVSAIEKEKEKGTVLTKTVIEDTVKKLQNLPMIEENSEEIAMEVIKELFEKYDYDLRKNSIEVDQGLNLSDPGIHKEWSPPAEGFYWPVHRDFIMESYKKKDPKSWDKTIKSIEDESLAILEKMESPFREEFDSKGLVIGYVQSGKTANFTALISRAMDAGYKLIVVLGGMHNTLRIQTQNRLDKELLGYDDYESGELNVEGIYRKKNARSRRPQRVTKTVYYDAFDETISDGEFDRRVEKLKEVLDVEAKYNKVIAVIKKNVAVLRKFNTWVESCPKKILDNTPILIIDDEADQASVDANYVRNKKKGKKLRENVTQTNNQILELLTMFKKKAYVGYTATPYANCFIDPHYGNLYPRNFIHFLPKPEQYFGAERIFGDETLKQCYVVSKEVGTKQEALEELQKDTLPESLTRAIYNFMVAFAIRILRGEESKPMSMLIHIDHRKQTQKDTFKLVKQQLKSIYSTLPHNSAVSRNLKERLKAEHRYIKEKGRIINDTAGISRKFFTFDEVLQILQDRIQDIEMKQVHSDSEDELDYARNPDMKVIAVGGNKLSRGLTLEGLTTTYFLRNTQLADTLMQMGRFFGYRGGYNDLMKIFCHKRILENFAYLIDLEADLRSEVERYIDEGKTPANFAPSVRAHVRMKPSGKMGNANRFRHAFGSSIVQTKYFPLENTELLHKNNDALEEFVTTMVEAKGQPSKAINGASSGRFFANVSIGIVADFFKNFNVEDFDLRKSDLLNYFKQNGYTKINVGIADLAGKDAKRKPLGNAGYFALINRSRKKTRRHEGFYNIGVLTDPRDLRMDLEMGAEDAIETRKIPLMVLYRINKESQASSENRQSLFAGMEDQKIDVSGFGVVLPKSKKEEFDVWGQDF